jgi:hypothetical protein
MEGCRRFFLTDTGSATLKQTNAEGYCKGAVEALFVTDVCAPESVTIQEAVGVVVQFIDRQPSRLKEPFAVLAREALEASWPCR